MKAVYLLPCSCGKKTRVDAGQSGAKVRCDCGQELAVPTFRGLKNLEVEAAPAAENIRGGPPAEWNALRGMLFSFGLLVTVIALGIGGFEFFLYYVRRDGGENYKQVVMANMSHEVEHLSPVDVLTEFQEMSKQGLSVDGVPPWATMDSFRDNNFRWLMVALVALVLGIASLAASIVGTRRKRMPQ